MTTQPPPDDAPPPDEDPDVFVPAAVLTLALALAGALLYSLSR